MGDGVILVPHNDLVVLCFNGANGSWIQEAVQYADCLLAGKCMFIRQMVSNWDYCPDVSFMDSLYWCEKLVDGAVDTGARIQLKAVVHHIKDIVAGLRLQSRLTGAYLCGYPGKCLVNYKGETKTMLEWRVSSTMVPLILDIIVKPFEQFCSGKIFEGILLVLAYGLSLDSNKVREVLECIGNDAAPQQVINSDYSKQLLVTQQLLERYLEAQTVASDIWAGELEEAVL